MKITHVNFARGFRGGERQTLNLLEGLARRGIAQSLVCRPGGELAERAASLGIEIQPTAHPLLGHLQQRGASITHVHEARGAYWAAIEYALRKTPYLITRRVPNPLSDSSITRAVYRHAQQLFGVSQDVSRQLSRQCGRNVRTIMSSSSFREADAVQVAALRKSFGGNGPVIGHVGALNDAHKGQSVLILAFQQLLNIYPDARLVLVGSGLDQAPLAHLAGHDPRIIFAGFQQQVENWIAAFDVFAFPSREEGLGSSVLDAMALGVPVACAGVGGLPELVGANQRGLLVRSHHPRDWAAALQSLLAEPIAAQKMTSAAKSFALQNNIDNMSSHYLSAYQHLLQGPALDLTLAAAGPNS